MALRQCPEAGTLSPEERRKQYEPSVQSFTASTSFMSRNALRWAP